MKNWMMRQSRKAKRRHHHPLRNRPKRVPPPKVSFSSLLTELIVEDQWNSVFKVSLGVPKLHSAWDLYQRIPLILDGRHAPPGAAFLPRHRISEDPEPVINQHTDACFVESLPSQFPNFL